MEKLICTLDSKLIGEYPFNKDKLTIGRNPKADVVIDNLAVSGIHAHINKIGADFLIEDNNSTNGTFVNEKPIKKHVLNDDDVIVIGRFQFKLMREQTAHIGKASAPQVIAPQVSVKAQTTAATEPKLTESKSSESSPAETPAQTPVQAKSEQKVAILLALNGEQKGAQLTLNKSMFSHSIQDQKIVITKRDNGFFISQIEGKNPILINGQALTTLTQKLNKNDVILMADINLQFIE